VSVPKGYELVRSGDQILYCRSDQITGTRFQTRVCVTEAQYKSQQQDLQEARDHLTLPHAGPCAVKQCAGGE
jgi:hypothetical protein